MITRLGLFTKPLAELGRRLNDANNSDVSGRVLFNVFGSKSALTYNIPVVSFEEVWYPSRLFLLGGQEQY